MKTCEHNPSKEKLGTDQKIKKILRKFEENDIAIDLEVVEELPRQNDRYMLEMKMIIEEDKLAVR